jgi:polygalacturonase
VDKYELQPLVKSPHTEYLFPCRPDHFIVLSKVLGNSFVTNLNIKNWPVHCFSVTSCDGLTISGLTLDNSAGNVGNVFEVNVYQNR